MTARRSAFSIVELLVVIGIIAVLISILLPSVGRAQEEARKVNCLSNLRQLAGAWMAYAVQSEGWICSADTNIPGNPYCWVDGGNTEDAIKVGKLYPFLNTTEVYRCPSDPRRLNLRSYSIQTAMNSSPFGPVKIYNRLAQLPRPTETIVFVEEYDPRGYNLGSFVIYNSGDGWVDYFPNWHGGGVTLSFADGHSEWRRWVDKRTATINNFYANTPNNEDLKWIQARAGY